VCLCVSVSNVCVCVSLSLSMHVCVSLTNESNIVWRSMLQSSLCSVVSPKFYAAGAESTNQMKQYAFGMLSCMKSIVLEAMLSAQIIFYFFNLGT